MLEREEVCFGDKKVLLKVIQGDLTSETTDTIVNAANSLLIHGAGLARAIANKAGE